MLKRMFSKEGSVNKEQKQNPKDVIVDVDGVEIDDEGMDQGEVESNEHKTIPVTLTFYSRNHEPFGHKVGYNIYLTLRQAQAWKESNLQEIKQKIQTFKNNYPNDSINFNPRNPNSPATLQKPVVADLITDHEILNLIIAAFAKPQMSVSYEGNKYYLSKEAKADFAVDQAAVLEELIHVDADVIALVQLLLDNGATDTKGLALTKIQDYLTLLEPKDGCLLRSYFNENELVHGKAVDGRTIFFDEVYEKAQELCNLIQNRCQPSPMGPLGPLDPPPSSFSPDSKENDQKPSPKMGATGLPSIPEDGSLPGATGAESNAQLFSQQIEGKPDITSTCCSCWCSWSAPPSQPSAPPKSRVSTPFPTPLTGPSAPPPPSRETTPGPTPMLESTSAPPLPSAPPLFSLSSS